MYQTKNDLPAHTRAAAEPAVRSLLAHAAAALQHYVHEESGRRNVSV
jgi:hypothetical protein